MAPADFLDLPVLADELPDSADAAGGLVFGCRVAPTVVGNNAFRVVTRPAGRAAARVTEFSLALAFGETARNRPDADFESDSVAATEVDRPAAPVDFPNLPGLADELSDSADAAGGLVFGETARIRFDADFESDSVDATDADRHAAPVDFPDLPGFADALPDSADAAGGLVFGRRVAPSVVGSDAAVRTCEGLRLREATPPAGRAATCVAEFSLALPFGETTRNRSDADFESDGVDATDVDRAAAPVDFPDLLGLADEVPNSADAAGGLVFGCRVAPSVVGNNAVRTCKGFRFGVATLPVGRAATRLVPP